MASAVVKAPLSPIARLLLWDYERGGLAWDVACLVILGVLFLVPPHLWGDPLAAAGRYVAGLLP
jgi:hypothetical protein